MAIPELAIFDGHTDCARAISRCDGAGFVEEKYAVFHIAPARDSQQRCATIELAVAFAETMATQRSRLVA
ncbi:hypothetical protein [Pseudomonas costantinii]|uniref:hypothetical protein n=1 Tax=Pseudomonas costantinii TaxID=168469 RepID=UPI0015A0089C|nr:hypothetical protein [Pseudomonas costantinii]